MQTSDYLDILRRRWWVILLTAVVAGIVALIFSRAQERIFRSEASYLVVPSRLDNGLQIVLQNRMTSFTSIALAPIQLEKISADLKIDRSADWLLDKHVAIQARPEEQLMIIQVDYPDADVAPRLANAIGDNMIALVNAQNNSIEGTDRINVRVNQPARPATLYWPRPQVIVPAGVLLGLILGLLLAFILEALDDTLKTPSDVERFIGLPTLGAIPESGDAGSAPRRTSLFARRKPNMEQVS